MTKLDKIAPITQLKKLPFMCCLKWVFEEMGNFSDEEDDSRILIVAVHALMLDAGFVGFVPDSKKQNGRLYYTLPEAFDSGNITNVEKTVALKFQDSPMRFLYIEGSLHEKNPEVHHLALDRFRFVPPLELAFENPVRIDAARVGAHGSSYNQSPEAEVLEFHRLVKDALVNPLLTSLRQKLGLAPPLCFMLLPPEIKCKILEYLSGLDIARVAAVCWELRELAETDAELRRLKHLYIFWHARRNMADFLSPFIGSPAWDSNAN